MNRWTGMSMSGSGSNSVLVRTFFNRSMYGSLMGRGSLAVFGAAAGYCDGEGMTFDGAEICPPASSATTWYIACPAAGIRTSVNVSALVAPIQCGVSVMSVVDSTASTAAQKLIS